MPFIVSKSRVMEPTSTLAFTTFEEAREHIIDFCEDQSEPMTQQTYALIESLSEYGDKLGLTDGCVIEVYRVTYNALRYYAGLEGVELYGLRDERRQKILDAYNALGTLA